MSTHFFNAGQGPILVEAEATGPLRSANLAVMLDTGATTSLIKVANLIYLGLDPGQSLQKVRMTTGSAIGIVPILVLTRLSASGHHRFGFPVLAHTLPVGSAVDGLLGLDSLQNQVLTVDFRAGQISLL